MNEAQLKAMAESANLRPMFIGPDNPQIKWLKGIVNNALPNPKGLMVIEGIWALEQALSCDVAVESVYICPELVYSPEGMKLAKAYMKKAQNLFVISQKTLDKVAEKGDNAGGILAACERKRYVLNDLPTGDNSLIVIMDGLEIPGNVGTILRTADGCGADGAVFVNKKVRLSHPKLVRSSQCACFSVPMVDEELNTVFEWLDRNRFSVYLLDTRATVNYHEADYQGPTALVVGSERYGLCPAWYQREHNKISIPMEGRCDSLNAAIAASIVLYQAGTKKRRG